MAMGESVPQGKSPVRMRGGGMAGVKRMRGGGMAAVKKMKRGASPGRRKR